VGSVLVAQTIPTDKSDPDFDADKLALRGKVMRNHESVGVLMLALLIPRVAFRLSTRVPGPIPGGNAVEHLGARLSHGFLYFALIFMPISGASFSYFSGWDTPFFAWNIPGAPKEDIAARPMYKKIEDFMYAQHHNVGKVLTYVLPLHVGAAFYHVARGHTIFRRMNPFIGV
jgi:cytochrome b561